MHPCNFRYHRAESFEQASELLRSFGLEGRAIAGGQTLIPMMKLRVLRPSELVDLRGIRGAQDIRETGDTIELGALARHQEIGKSAIATTYPILRDCGLGIADVQVRNMGTIGGSLAEADPSGCWPTLLATLNARVRCLRQGGTFEQSISELIADAYTPNLASGELITSILIDRKVLSGFGSYVAFKRAAPAYPTASCAVVAYYEGEVIHSVRLGFGCLGLTAITMDASDVLGGKEATPELVGDVADKAAALVEPMSDNKGSEAYKRSLLRGLIKRAFDNVDRRRKGESALQTHFYYG